jgi:hypothetical protein
MVFIAGLIFSSFPHERIRSNHPHKMNIIERTPETRTKSEIASNMNSPKSICFPRIEFVASKAYAFSKNIIVRRLIKYF